MFLIENLRKTLIESLPIAIESQVGKVYTSPPEGASYFWLVRFSNGIRIPYPVMSLEGVDASLFSSSSRVLSLDESLTICAQESMVRAAFSARKELAEAFENLKASATKEYEECEECEKPKNKNTLALAQILEDLLKDTNLILANKKKTQQLIDYTKELHSKFGTSCELNVLRMNLLESFGIDDGNFTADWDFAPCAVNPFKK